MKQVTRDRKFNTSGAPLGNSVKKSDSSYLELLFHRWPFHRSTVTHCRRCGARVNYGATVHARYECGQRRKESLI